MRKLWLASTVSLVCLAAGFAAQAQSSIALGEVIVTSQRREESIQKAAISVAAVSAQEVVRNNVTSVADLQKLVPAFQALNGAGPYATYAIRGVSGTTSNAFGDSTVQINLNGVPLARVTSAKGQMFDLDRVEVLKGPQGTLYGRNATAGAVNIISARPKMDEYQSSIQITAGNYNRIGTEGVVNIPLSDKLAARVAFQTEDRDGFFSDGSDDDHRKSARASVLWEPSDTVSFLVIGDYTTTGGIGQGGTAVSNTAPYGFVGNPWTSIVQQSAFLTPLYMASKGGVCGSGAALAQAGPRPCLALPDNAFSRGKFWGLSGELNWKIGPGTLTVVAGHRRDDYSYNGLAAGFIQNENGNLTDQSSLEMRYATDAARRLSVVVGAFGSKSDQSGNFAYDQQATGTTSIQTINFLRSDAKAAFADGTFKLTDSFRISAGVRYSEEEKSINATLGNVLFFRPFIDPVGAAVPGTAFLTTGDKTWSATNWRLVAAWDWRAGSLLYASVGTGFKAGTFFLSPDNNTINPENVTAYTIGSKNRLLDGRLILNAEVFQLNYKNQQIAILGTPASAPNTLIFPSQNAGASTIKGAEVQADLQLFAHTRLSGNIQYLNTRYDEFSPITVFLSPQNCPFTNAPAVAGSVFRRIQLNCAGMPLVRAPEWSGYFSVTQDVPLASGAHIEFNANYRYTDKQYTSASYSPASLIPASKRINLSATYHEPQERWTVQAWVENVTNEVDLSTRGPSVGNVTLYFGNLLPPRTYGVTFAAKFGGPGRAVEPPPPSPSATGSRNP